MRIAAAIAFTALAATAHATPHDDADALYRQGRTELAAGKIAEACTSFEKSDKLDPAPTTLLALGVCREKIGQLATAWQIYLEVGKRLQGATDATGRALAKVAADDAAKLETRLSKLTISVKTPVDGLEIKRGDVAIAATSWNQAVPVDGGTYAIAATAPGRLPWSGSVNVATERDAQTLEIPTLAPVDVAVVAPKVVPPTPPPPPPVAPQPPSRALPIALGIGAVVLGGIAIGLDVSAHSTYTKSQGEADDARQASLYNSANNKLYMAQGLGAAAVISAGVAVFLFVHSGHGESSAVAIAPLISNDQVGLAIGGRY